MGNGIVHGWWVGLMEYIVHVWWVQLMGYI